MRQLTSLDAQFLALEDGRALGHVGGLAIYEPETAEGDPLDVERVRALLSERLHMLPPFRWRLVEVPFGLDHPYWIEDDEFDLEFHVRELALPAPGNTLQLAEQTSRIFSRQLDRAHPLWELYVISGLEDGSVAMLTKIHHAAVDGVSGAEILAVLLDFDPAGREIPEPEERETEQQPGELEMLSRGLTGMWKQPVRAIRAAPRVLPNLDSVPTMRTMPGVKTIAGASRRVARLMPQQRPRTVLEGRSLSAPHTRFQERISAHRRFAFGSLSLSEVKEIKNEFGCTVNDVVMAICTSALRSWLLERDELPADPLISMVPVSVRTPEQIGTYGNRVSVMIVPLPSNVADPLERLRQMNRTMSSAKERHQALPASLLGDANHFIPPALFAQAARVTSRVSLLRGVEAPVNVTISNVPGSPAPLYCAGAQQRGTYPISAIIDGVGLNITVFSYQDSLDFGIVADREQMDDPWPLLGAIREGLAELRVLATAGVPAPD